MSRVALPSSCCEGTPAARSSYRGAPRRKIGRSLASETARLRYAGKGVRTARPPPNGLLLAVRQDEVVDDLGRLDVGDPVGLLPLHLLDDARPLLFRLGAGRRPVEAVADAALRFEDGLAVRRGGCGSRRGRRCGSRGSRRGGGF